MEPFTRVFTATEDYFITVPIRQILRKIYRIQSCSGNPTRYIFGNLSISNLVQYIF